ncbi:Protein-methionine sulfoxide oxidase MICAL3, partial [Dryobates pubescens]
GIDLENIVYYKDDTHYFVMTAKKQSLLKKGVILQDKVDIESLLAPENVNRDALLSYAKEAANFSTNYCLPELEFALNHRALPDVDMFDFTCMTRSENAALVREHNGARLLLGLVGDCLVEVRVALAAPPWASIFPLLPGVLVASYRASLSQLPGARHLWGSTPQGPAVGCFASPTLVPPAPGPPVPPGRGSSCPDFPPHPIYLEPWLVSGWLPHSSQQQLFSGDAYEELLSWCQASTAGYRGVAVTNFTTSWTSGLALCALIHHFHPDLVDFDSIDPQDPIQIHQMMLDKAEQELGIQPVLSSTEMATMAEPDRLGLITYLSQFYEAFKTSPEEEEVSQKPLSPRGTRGAILFLSKLQKSRNLTHKRTQDNTQQDAETKRICRDTKVDVGLDGDTPDAAHKLLQRTMSHPGQVGLCCPEWGSQLWAGGGTLGTNGTEPRAGSKAVQENTHRLPAPPCLLPDPTGFPKPGLAAPSLVPTNPSTQTHLCSEPPGLPAEPRGRVGASTLVSPQLALSAPQPPARGDSKGKPTTLERTLTRRARDAQTKRFRQAQAIQRRLEEIEVTFRELEQQGIKLEKLLRDEGGTPEEQKTQWMNQLLYLVQKKNNLLSEESDLMIVVQELKLEEEQWQLDQKLRYYESKEESLKTPEDRIAAQEILAQLLEVVRKRDALILRQEEKRLSEL